MGVRTHDLQITSQTRYPLRHVASCACLFPMLICLLCWFGPMLVWSYVDLVLCWFGPMSIE